MNKRRYGTLLVVGICLFLTVAAFFAKDFVLFDFHMNVSDYAYNKTEEERPPQVATDFWFSYGQGGLELLYGYADEVSSDDVRLYALTAEQAVPVSENDMHPIREDFAGNFIAALPLRELDMDGDGFLETVHDFARSDLGLFAFNPTPQRFNHPDITFELVFAERKYIMVYFENQLMTDTEIQITGSDGRSHTYVTDYHGWIDGLPIRDIRNGFTASYSPDNQNFYRMYYALEDYPYFTQHFWKAHIPLLIIFGLTAVGIVIFHLVRGRIARRNPAYTIYSRKRSGFRPGYAVSIKTDSRFLLIRWLCLIAGMFLWTYAGKIIGQGQLLNEVAVPVFACPFNLDQVLEVPCYYISHLPALFNRFGPDFAARNIFYAAVFLITLFLCFTFLGRILCGFLCPAGFLQDVMDKVRDALHIRPIIVTDRMNKFLQPIKWVWIILFLGFAFVGGDFCDICPIKPFATAQGGFWTNLYLGGILAVVILIGSFFIKRFWCIICPLGYLMGILKKFNVFKLKKNCSACTECGACYEACPIRIKTIYTEREESDIQTVDCLMCGECIHKGPENDALAMTLCGKPIYKSSRESFMSRYANMNQEKSGAARKNGGVGNDE
jgi:ferredoxin